MVSNLKCPQKDKPRLIGHRYSLQFQNLCRKSKFWTYMYCNQDSKPASEIWSLFNLRLIIAELSLFVVLVKFVTLVMFVTIVNLIMHFTLVMICHILSHFFTCQVLSYLSHFVTYVKLVKLCHTCCILSHSMTLLTFCHTYHI